VKLFSAKSIGVYGNQNGDDDSDNDEDKNKGNGGDRGSVAGSVAGSATGLWRRRQQHQNSREITWPSQPGEGGETLE
jgi:hypothetical protein